MSITNEEIVFMKDTQGESDRLYKAVKHTTEIIAKYIENKHALKSIAVFINGGASALIREPRLWFITCVVFLKTLQNSIATLIGIERSPTFSDWRLLYKKSNKILASTKLLKPILQSIADPKRTKNVLQLIHDIIITQKSSTQPTVTLIMQTLLKSDLSKNELEKTIQLISQNFPKIKDILQSILTNINIKPTKVALSFLNLLNDSTVGIKLKASINIWINEIMNSEQGKDLLQKMLEKYPPLPTELFSNHLLIKNLVNIVPSFLSDVIINNTQLLTEIMQNYEAVNSALLTTSAIKLFTSQEMLIWLGTQQNILPSLASLLPFSENERKTIETQLVTLSPILPLLAQIPSNFLEVIKDDIVQKEYIKLGIDCFNLWDQLNMKETISRQSQDLSAIPATTVIQGHAHALGIIASIIYTNIPDAKKDENLSSISSDTIANIIENFLQKKPIEIETIINELTTDSKVDRVQAILKIASSDLKATFKVIANIAAQKITGSPSIMKPEEVISILEHRDKNTVKTLEAIFEEGYKQKHQNLPKHFLQRKTLANATFDAFVNFQNTTIKEWDLRNTHFKGGVSFRNSILEGVVFNKKTQIGDHKTNIRKNIKNAFKGATIDVQTFQSLLSYAQSLGIRLSLADIKLQGNFEKIDLFTADLQNYIVLQSTSNNSNIEKNNSSNIVLNNQDLILDHIVEVVKTAVNNEFDIETLKSSLKSVFFITKQTETIKKYLGNLLLLNKADALKLSNIQNKYFKNYLDLKEPIYALKQFSDKIKENPNNVAQGVQHLYESLQTDYLSDKIGIKLFGQENNRAQDFLAIREHLAQCVKSTEIDATQLDLLSDILETAYYDRTSYTFMGIASGGIQFKNPESLKQDQELANYISRALEGLKKVGSDKIKNLQDITDLIAVSIGAQNQRDKAKITASLLNALKECTCEEIKQLFEPLRLLYIAQIKPLAYLKGVISSNSINSIKILAQELKKIASQKQSEILEPQVIQALGGKNQTERTKIAAIIEEELLASLREHQIDIKTANVNMLGGLIGKKGKDDTLMGTFYKIANTATPLETTEANRAKLKECALKFITQYSNRKIEMER